MNQAAKAGATEFLDLMEEAGLTKTLRTLNNFTVFLPTNEAIQVIHLCLPSEVADLYTEHVK